MTKPMKISSQALVEEARARIEEITPEDAKRMLGRDDVVFVDIRDIRELKRDGRLPGSVHCPRGMLEFWVDPESPYFKPVFGEDKRFVFYCAADWRSALATDTVQRMGLQPVAHLKGGFRGWKAAEGPVDTLPE